MLLIIPGPGIVQVSLFFSDPVSFLETKPALTATVLNPIRKESIVTHNIYTGIAIKSR